MGRRYTSLPTKNALHRFRVAMWVCGVLLVAIGGARVHADQFAYTTRLGLVWAPFLIVLGLLFLALAILGRPKTQN